MKFNIANIADLLCTMQSRQVLVLGDIMLDRFIDGTVDRISPEAPVPVLSQSQTRQMAGGEGNACAVETPATPPGGIVLGGRRGACATSERSPRAAYALRAAADGKRQAQRMRSRDTSHAT